MEPRGTCCVVARQTQFSQFNVNNKFVRPRWPYDMQPSARAEKYIRDAGP